MFNSQEDKITAELKDCILYGMASNFIKNENISKLISFSIEIFYSFKFNDELSYTLDSFNVLLEDEEVKDTFDNKDIVIFEYFIKILKKRSLYKYNNLYRKVVKFIENLYIYKLDQDFIDYLLLEINIIHDKVIANEKI